MNSCFKKVIWKWIPSHFAKIKSSSWFIYLSYRRRFVQGTPPSLPFVFLYYLFTTNRDTPVDFNKIVRNKEFPIPFQRKEMVDKAAQRIPEVVDVQLKLYSLQMWQIFSVKFRKHIPLQEVFLTSPKIPTMPKSQCRHPWNLDPRNYLWETQTSPQ